MKANKKFKLEDDSAVSAVIGVILMVAITVAIAATVYVYVSGMIGSSPEQTPNMQLIKDGNAGKLTVASADPGDLEWADFEISLNGTIHTSTNWDSNFTGSMPNDIVTAGDYIELDSGVYGTLTIRHVNTNTLVGSWTFS
jgi:flagellin-like protein